MRWNWTQPAWPNFSYDSAAVEPLERRFLLSSGEIVGAVRHVTDDERDSLRIELLSEEATRGRSSLVASTGRRCISKYRPRRRSKAGWTCSSISSAAPRKNGPRRLGVSGSIASTLRGRQCRPRRALAERSLAQNIRQPNLIALAYTIERDRKGNYDQLNTHEKTLYVTV